MTVSRSMIALATGMLLAFDSFADAQPPKDACRMYEPLAEFVTARRGEFDRIDAGRRAQLDALSAYIREQRAADKPVRLNFICTHNSRRSHMSQLWAAVAAEAYGIPVTVYSGGTEATAFNPRAVAAMERAGFRIEKTTDDKNPIYHVRVADNRPALTCFSKRYDNAPNSTEGFAAVMVCDQADAACPTVSGAAARFSLPFVDPKAADGTPKEAETYDARCAQIARELLYVMSRAAG